MIDAAQIRAARALLNWRQEDLAHAARVGSATIRRIEKSGKQLAAFVSTVVRIQKALEEAGILFIDADETGGTGLRWSKKKRTR